MNQAANQRTEQTAAQPWYKTARRWLQLNLTEDVCENLCLDHWRAHWNGAPYQGVILNCGGIVCYYQSKYRFQTVARGMGERDIFGLYAQAAREDGLAVAARFDMQVIDASFEKEHPDWFLRDKEGNLYRKGERAETCINSGYYTEALPMMIEEVIEKHHPDAFTDNSWKANNKLKICYCAQCRKLFKEYSGRELPETVNWEDPVYRKWIKWSYACRVRTYDHLNETARRASDGQCLWIGMFHGDPMNRLNEFIDFHELGKRLKFLFLDHQCRDAGNGMDVEQNSMNGSMYRLMSDENMIVTECTNHYQRVGASARWYRQAASAPVETRMWEQEGIAGGISPWVHFMGTVTRDLRRESISTPLLKWHQKYERFLSDRTELSDVAEVWSQENGDFYGRAHANEVGILPWMGARHALMKGRIPFLPINAHDIGRHGHRVRTLILPDLAVLSGEDEREVLRFVQRGGNLVILGKSATLDEEGEPRAELPLWDALGLAREGEEGSALESGAPKNLRLTDPAHGVFAELEGAQKVAFRGLLQKVQSRGPLACIAQTEEGAQGAVFAGELPSGARVVYFAADIDRCYGRDGLPDHRRLLTGAINWTLRAAPLIRVEGPGNLSVKVYRQQSRVIVHLNNITGSDPHAGLNDQFYPVGPVRVELRVEAGTDARAYLAVAEREAPLTRTGDGVRIDIDRIEDHEMIVLETGR